MARFYQSEGGEYRFNSEDGLDEPITQDNYWVWLHREEPLKDLAQVEDHRDSLSWYWFRYDLGNERFNELDMIARAAGRVILGSIASEQVDLVFFNRHQFTDDDIQQLLEGE